MPRRRHRVLGHYPASPHELRSSLGFRTSGFLGSSLTADLGRTAGLRGLRFCTEHSPQQCVRGNPESRHHLAEGGAVPQEEQADVQVLYTGKSLKQRWRLCQTPGQGESLAEGAA
ncbi:unnamed protein product [Symbiodinium natans]|uniref:Uncharacterized protein n=1 Tax=Symbiodinium natans TaxID=878477 RepID=A0A812V3P7_9DINO|nr:unnamed protein product [Symbiodinium natans]